MSDTAPKKTRSLGWYLLLGVIVVIVVGFVAVALWRTFMPNADVWTNDAQIETNYTVISPRISGRVAAVPVDDNQPVRAGELLVRLDVRDYETAVAAAKARLATARAGQAEIIAEITRQPTLIAQAKAKVTGDRAAARFARHNAERYDTLAQSHGISREQQQRQQSAADTAEAQLAADQAALDNARKQLDVLKARRQQAAADIQQARADLAQAQLNLSYTRVRAPTDGVIAQRAARPGQWVGAGTALMALVPLKRLFVLAYYRETELTHVAPGQAVSIHVDAYPDMPLTGHVASLAPATGVTFSPVAPDNATGNFTKVVQRLPVKIVIDPGQNAIAKLKQGLSVETTIHTGLATVQNNLGIYHDGAGRPSADSISSAHAIHKESP